MLFAGVIFLLILAFSLSMAEISEPMGPDVPAWAAQASSDVTRSPSPSAAQMTPPVPATTDTPETPPPPAPFTMIFGGDVLLDRGVGSKLGRDNDYTKIIDPALADLFNDSTLSFVNLESPFSLRGKPHEDKQYTFRGHPAHLPFLAYLGISAVTLANNHTLDYGVDALVDTLDELDAIGIGRAGAGRNLAEAMTPYIHTVGDQDAGGMTVAFLAASRVVPTVAWHAGPNHPGVFTTYDPAGLYAAIAETREIADLIVVYVHWGQERNPYPLDYQVNMARGYIDAGADLVIGSHPHVLQGLEYYNGKWIAYSLGNFIFTDAKRDTMALQFIVNGEEIRPRAIFCRINSMRTEMITKQSDLETLRRYLEDISYHVAVDEEGFISPK